MQQKDTLTQRAANIANAVPTQWRDFIDALAGYTEVHQENLLKSPLPDLPVNQGRAQALTALHKVLKDCTADAEKIRRNTK